MSIDESDLFKHKLFTFLLNFLFTPLIQIKRREQSLDSLLKFFVSFQFCKKENFLIL
jgi:hypothetical protein